MSLATLQYDAKVDSRKRITLRDARFEYYHAVQYDDGRILLEPRELVAPFQISENTLRMMDQSMENLGLSKVSDAIDLSGFED